MAIAQAESSAETSTYHLFHLVSRLPHHLKRPPRARRIFHIRQDQPPALGGLVAALLGGRAQAGDGRFGDAGDVDDGLDRDVDFQPGQGLEPRADVVETLRGGGGPIRRWMRSVGVAI